MKNAVISGLFLLSLSSSAFASGRFGTLYACNSLQHGPDFGTEVIIQFAPGPTDKPVYTAKVSEQTIALPRPLFNENVSLKPYDHRPGSPLVFTGKDLEISIQADTAPNLPYRGRIVAEFNGRRMVEDLECVRGTNNH